VRIKGGPDKGEGVNQWRPGQRRRCESRETRTKENVRIKGDPDKGEGANQGRPEQRRRCESTETSVEHCEDPEQIG